MLVDTIMSCEQFEELTAAYALDALEPADRDRLEAHLQHCPACAAELTALQQVTAQLALTLPQHDPSPSLRQRVLAAAASDGQTEPKGDGASQQNGGTAQRPVLASSARLRQATPWRLGLLAAALAAFIWAASLQVQLINTQRQLAETSAQLERSRGNYNAVIGVLASPGLVVRDLRPGEAAPNARSMIWIDHVSGEGMMMARDLPPLGENQTYQVWLNNAQGRVSPGFLRRYEDGFYYLILDPPGRLTDYQRLGVTAEPLGGSPAPTGPRVVEGEL